MSEKNIRVASHQSKLYQKDDKSLIVNCLHDLNKLSMDCLNLLNRQYPDWFKIEQVIKQIEYYSKNAKIELNKTLNS